MRRNPRVRLVRFLSRSEEFLVLLDLVVVPGDVLPRTEAVPRVPPHLLTLQETRALVSVEGSREFKKGAYQCGGHVNLTRALIKRRGRAAVCCLGEV